MSAAWWHQRKSQVHQSHWDLLSGNMNVCTIFHGNPSNSSWDISFWIKVVDQPTDRHCHLLSHPTWQTVVTSMSAVLTQNNKWDLAHYLGNIQLSMRLFDQSHQLHLENLGNRKPTAGMTKTRGQKGTPSNPQRLCFILT